MRAIILLGFLALTACGENASTYDDKRGRYVSTDEFKKDYGIKDVCQMASCYDSHSGHWVSGDELNKRNSQWNRDNPDRDQR